MPPKMNLRNILQMMQCPAWSWQTLLAGVPEMQTLKPYMPKNMPTSELANFMNNTVMGAVDFDSLKVIRDNWDGPLVLKGLVNPDDVKQAVALGADAVVLSNHGAAS
jgi:L-lactate dehydrogenase (FMN-dependent) and related alpha-hydroxy acid dehydrogenases